jgi:hypothetical protein
MTKPPLDVVAYIGMFIGIMRLIFTCYRCIKARLNRIKNSNLTKEIKNETE